MTDLDKIISAISNNEEFEYNEIFRFLNLVDNEERASILVRFSKAFYYRSGNYINEAEIFAKRAYNISNEKIYYSNQLINILIEQKKVEEAKKIYKRVGLEYLKIHKLQEALFYFDKWLYAYPEILKMDKYEYDWDIQDAINAYVANKGFESNAISSCLEGKLKIGLLVNGITQFNSVLIKINYLFAKYHDKKKFKLSFFFPETESEILNSKQGKSLLESFRQLDVQCFYADDISDYEKQLFSVVEKIQSEKIILLVTSASLGTFSHYFISSFKPAPIMLGFLQGPPPQFISSLLDWAISWTYHPLIDSPVPTDFVKLQLELTNNIDILQRTKEFFGLPEKSQIVMSGGRYVKFQDIQYIKSLLNIIIKDSNRYLVIIGPSIEQIPFIVNLAEEEILKRVRIFPWMENYLELARHADVMIDTYPSGGGVLLFEIASLGIPIITFQNDYNKEFDQTQWSPLKEFINNDELTLKRGDYNSITEVADRLLRDEQLKIRLGNKCAEEINEKVNNPEVTVRKCEEVFLKLIQDRLGSEYIPFIEKDAKVLMDTSHSDIHSETKKPTFSVIVPTYNQDSYLGEALDSLLAQSFTDWEAIIVNDGSTDNTKAVMEDYARNDSRFRLFHKENGGVSTALNMGIKNAYGNWICWLSSDDTFEPIALETFSANINRYPDEVFFHSDFNEFYEDTKVLKPTGPERAKLFPGAFLQSIALLEYNLINGISICINKKVFDIVGYFREDFRNAQDFDMWLRCSMNFKLIHIPVITCTTRYHSQMDTFSAPRFGLYDGATSCIEHLNKYKFEEFIKFADPNNYNELVAILKKIIVIILNPDALLHQGVGHHFLFEERVSEWIKERLPENLILDVIKQFKGLYQQCVQLNYNEIYTSKFKYLSAGIEQKQFVKILEPIKLLAHNKEYHKSIGNFKEAESIEKYIQRLFKLSGNRLIDNEKIEKGNINIESESKNRTTEEVVSIFSDIYSRNSWLSEESVSGPGSTNEQTKTIREEIPKLLENYSIKSILDLPCGDFNWMKNVNLEYIDYTGGDLVEDIIKRNNEQFSKNNIHFKILNLIKDDLPDCDLILVRDCFVHFSFKDAIEAIRNIKRSKIKYLLTTTFLNRRENADIVTGSWRPLNLQKYPFNFPEPIAIINENCTEDDGNFNDKCLCLWCVSDLPDFENSNNSVRLPKDNVYSTLKSTNIINWGVEPVGMHSNCIRQIIKLKCDSCGSNISIQFEYEMNEEHSEFKFICNKCKKGFVFDDRNFDTNFMEFHNNIVFKGSKPILARNIGYLIPDMSSIGGGTKIALKHIKWLFNLGFDVTFYSYSVKPDWLDLNIQYMKINDAIEIDEQRSDLFILSSIFDIPKILNKIPITKVVLLCQGYEGYHFGSDYLKSRSEKHILTKLHSIPFKTILVSKHLVELFKSKFNREGEYIPNCIDHNVFTFSAYTTEREKSILFIGNPYHPLKGFNFLANTIKIIQDSTLKISSLKLYIVMGFTLDNYLEIQKIIEKAIDCKVEFQFKLDSDQIASLMKKVSVFTCTSWYEGFSLPLLEAMACGTPVITTSNMGAESFCFDKQNSFVINYGDFGGFAQSIVDIMHNRYDLKKILQNAYSTSLEYSEFNSEKAHNIAFKHLIESSIHESDNATKSEIHKSKNVYSTESTFTSTIETYTENDATQLYGKSISIADKNNSQRILFVVHNFPPHWFAGTENYTYSLAKELIKNGNEVSVFYPRIDMTTKMPAIHETHFKGIKIYEYLYSNSNSGNLNEVSSSILTRFKELLMENNFDVIHFHHTEGLPIEIVSIPVKLQIKTVITLHDFHLFCRRNHLFIPGLKELCIGPETPMKCVECLYNDQYSETDKSKLANYFEMNLNYLRGLFPQTNIITAPSKYVMDKYKEYGLINDSFFIKPLGLKSINYQEKLLYKEKIVFGYIGSIAPVKNINILTETFTNLKTESAVLEIWGNGGADSIQELVKDIQNSKNISYQGPYDSDKIGEILSRFDIIIVPSFNETYSITIREALICKIPVIASNRGAIPEIINYENGFLFDPNNSKELLMIIEKIIQNPEIINIIKKKIKPVISINEDALEWISIYNSIGGSNQTKNILSDNEIIASIIIPTFNNLKYTKECLESIHLHTNNLNFEVIIVDNASTDGSIEYLQKEIKKFKSGKLILNGENIGFAKGCNQGIKASKGKYVVLLNNDTTATEGWLEHLIKEAESDSSVGIIGSCLLYPGNDFIQHAGVVIGTDDGKTLAPYHKLQLFKLSETPEARVSRNYTAVTGACMLITKELINKIGSLDEDYINGLEDIDYCFSAILAGFKVRYCASSKLYHHESISTNRHKYDVPNWKRLNQKWLGKITFDESASETRNAKLLIANKEIEYKSRLQEEIDFSIIIPVHNKLEFTRTCIEAIYSTKGNYKIEIIIIDNASTDKTIDYLKSLNSGIIIISNSINENYSIANNKGAKIAKGNILIFLNNDTLVQPGWLEAILYEFNTNPDTGIQGAKLLYENGRIQHSGMIFGVRPGREIEPYHVYLMADPNAPFVNKRREVQFVTGALLSIRKDDFNKVDGFDERYVFGWEDSDICMKIASLGKKIIYNPQVVSYHFESGTKLLRKSMGDDMVSSDTPKERRNRELFLKKWADKLEDIADEFYAEDGLKIANNSIVPMTKDEIERYSRKSHLQRVLFTMYGWNETGGGTIFPKSVAKELKNRGYEIAVFYADLKIDNKKPYYSMDISFDSGVKLYGIYNRPAQFIDPDNPEREIHDKGVLDKFSEVLNDFKPDVIHFQNFHGLTFAMAEEAFKRSIPSCYTPHNYHMIDPNLYLFNNDLTLWKGTDLINNSEAVKRNPNKIQFYMDRIAKTKELLNNWVNITLCVSTRQRELISEHSGSDKRLAVVHQSNEITDRLWENNVIEKQLFRKINKPLRIGFIGGVMAHKGVHYIAAISQAFNKTDIEFHIYGFATQPYFDQLKAIDKKGNLIFHGEYDINELEAIAENTDLAIVPSLWEDCAPLVLLELHALRLPIIGARIGGIPDFIESEVDGFLYTYDSIEDLFSIINRCASDPGLVEKMRHNITQKHSFKKYIDHLGRIYMDLAKGTLLPASEYNLIINDSSTKLIKTEMNNYNTSSDNSDESYFEALSDRKIKVGSDRSQTEKLKLNLGCGDAFEDGFINIDLNYECPDIVKMDARILEYDDASVDTILAADLLQCFSHNDISDVFAEWARVLKPDGSLIISCTSFKQISRLILNGLVNAETASKLIFGNQQDEAHFYYSAFDEDFLRKELLGAGFTIQSYDESDVADSLDDINLSIVVSAVKSSSKGLQENETVVEQNDPLPKINYNFSPDAEDDKVTDNLHSSEKSHISGLSFNFDDKVDDVEYEVIEPETEFDNQDYFAALSDTKSVVMPSQALSKDVPQINIVWEGSQFVWHSLALINREICYNIIKSGVAELTIVPYEPDTFLPEGNPKYELLKQHDIRYKLESDSKTKKLPYSWIRHQWPPKAEEPKGSKWFIIQPWEFSTLRSDFVNIFKNADEVWTPSNYSRNSFINSGIEFDHAQVIPNGCDPELWSPMGKRFKFNTDKKLKFLFVGGTIYRKGIDVLLQAYVRTFTGLDNVCLIIKDMGGDTFYAGQTAKKQIDIIQKSENTPEIIYIDDYFTEEQMVELYKACDVFVCPYRGEGFSLPTLEAMASGLPVIVTKGGSTDDFVDESIGWLISADKKSIGREIGGFPLTGEAYLLEPNEDELVDTMKKIYGDPSQIFSKGLLAALKARTEMTWKKATIKLLSRLDLHNGTTMAKIAEKTLEDYSDDAIILGEIEKMIIAKDSESAYTELKKLLADTKLTDRLLHHAYCRMAELCINLVKLDEVDQYLQKAGEIYNSIDELYLEANKNFAEEKYSDALDGATKAMQNWKNDKYDSTIGLNIQELLLFTADTLLNDDDPNGALLIYLEVLKLNNNNADAYFGAGVSHLKMGSNDDALRMFEWSLRINPDHEMAKKMIDGLKITK